jgi:FkbH-like protein
MSGLAVNGSAGSMPAAGWPRIRALSASGLLGEHYDELPALLAELDDDGLYRAGRLLSRVDAERAKARHRHLRTANVFITSNFTCNAVGEFLTAQMARHGIVAKCEAGAYNQYLFDLGSPDSRLGGLRPDLTVCLLGAQVIFDTLPETWTAVDVEAALSTTLAQLERLASDYLERAPGTLVMNTLALPSSWLNQTLSYQRRMRIGAAWREANARLLRMGAERDRLLVVDLEALLTATGPLGDSGSAVYAGAHIRDEILSRYAREVAHMYKALSGGARKCLVVDLDGTLWGGILGDDGSEDIELGEYDQGPAFREFQRVLRQLASQGVLLAVCSKNDDEKVRHVLREHPRMLLRESDFVAIKANWQPKSDNLIAIAAELNVGDDSIVFVDDNSFECGLVRRALPQVAVVQLSEEPASHAERLLTDCWFTAPTLTQEDYARRETYASDSQRRSLREASSSIDEYLHELQIRVALYVAAENDAPRLSQLTLRTNQFNMTAMRMDVAELKRRLNAPECRVLGIRASDRYGEQGLVGALFLHADGKRIIIENMLLSCRVFSRGIETSCLAALLAHAKANGLQSVVGRYCQTTKNLRFADLFERHGFTYVREESGCREFQHALGDLPAAVAHIALTADIPRVP